MSPLSPPPLVIDLNRALKAAPPQYRVHTRPCESQLHTGKLHFGVHHTTLAPTWLVVPSLPYVLVPSTTTSLHQTAPQGGWLD